MGTNNKRMRIINWVKRILNRSYYDAVSLDNWIPLEKPDEIKEEQKELNPYTPEEAALKPNKKVHRMQASGRAITAANKKRKQKIRKQKESRKRNR